MDNAALPSAPGPTPHSTRTRGVAVVPYSESVARQQDIDTAPPRPERSADHPAPTRANEGSLLRPCSPIAEQIGQVDRRMREILLTGGEFDDIYRHILTAPGKRVRAGLALACAQLIPSPDAAPVHDALDIACVWEMFHESSLVHDDICDGSPLRRDAPSVPAAFGVRRAARAGFHLAGKALQVLARVIADNPAAFGTVGTAAGVTYLDRLSDLSLGQLVETIPPTVDHRALRGHYARVAAAKTGTLFRLACAYGGTAGALEHDRLRDLMDYAERLAFAFQVMDDVRDVDGGPGLGKDACGDLDRRVPTWPVIEWLAEQRAAVDLWLDPATPTGVLQSALADSGAIARARAHAVATAEAARRALAAFPLSPAKEHLDRLAVRVVTR
ncbi:putative polyprenyl synthase [Nocardia farcinica IFM 10152]|nr:putative polyprenyl synthase [Nocardia farcinica IFM 10152]